MISERIAVTGASGLIGFAVRQALVPVYEVLSVGRRPESDLWADFSDPNSIQSLDLRGISALVHCAGIVDEDFQIDPARAFRHATCATSALVNRAITCGIRRLAYISSAHVYGSLDGTITEDSPPNPLSDYAIAHFASEQIFRRRASGSVQAVVFRPNAVYGIPPNLCTFRRWSLIPFAFPRDAITKGRIVLKSSGEQRRNFVGTNDIAHSVLTWLGHGDRFPVFAAVNPIGRTTITVWEFAQLCAVLAERITGRPCSLHRPAPDYAQASIDFNYTTRHPNHIGIANLEEGIFALMNHLLSKIGEQLFHDNP